MIDREANRRFIHTPYWPGTYACGVYVIINTRTQRLYLGSSYQVGRRWASHVYALRMGKHTARALQADWNTYGHEAFQFRMIERVSRTTDLSQREQAYQWVYRDRLYNHPARALKVAPGALLVEADNG